MQCEQKKFAGSNGRSVVIPVHRPSHCHIWRWTPWYGDSNGRKRTWTHLLPQANWVPWRQFSKLQLQAQRLTPDKRCQDSETGLFGSKTLYYIAFLWDNTKQLPYSLLNWQHSSSLLQSNTSSVLIQLWSMEGSRNSRLPLQLKSIVTSTWTRSQASSKWADSDQGISMRVRAIW